MIDGKSVRSAVLLILAVNTHGQKSNVIVHMSEKRTKYNRITRKNTDHVEGQQLPTLSIATFPEALCTLYITVTGFVDENMPLTGLKKKQYAGFLCNFENKFPDFSRHCPDLTFPSDLPRSNTGTVTLTR